MIRINSKQHSGNCNIVVAIVLFFTLSGCNSTWFYRQNTIQYRPLDNISKTPSYYLDSYSGNRIHTLLIPTKNQSKRTLIVHFHGNNGNLTWTSEKFDWLNQYGYDLLVFDYSGYGLSSGQPNPHNTWLDAKTILDHVLELNKAKKRWDKIVLAGTSLGGNILLYTLNQYHVLDQFDLLLLDSSFLSYKKIATELLNRSILGKLVAWSPELFISDDYAPRISNDLANVPLLVVHCEQDDLIPPVNSRLIYNSFPTSSKSFWLFNNCVHAQGFSNHHPKNRLKLVHYLDRSFHFH